MSDDPSAAPVEPAVQSGPWVPGEKERGLLLGAAVCCILAAGATCLKLWLDIQQVVPADRFTVAEGLGLGAILLQIAIVVCLGTMAEQTGAKSLVVSGGCYYACGWLLGLTFLSLETFMPMWARITLWVVGGIGILAVFGFIGEKYKGFESVGGLILIGSYFAVRYGAIALFNVRLGFGETVLIAGVLFLLIGSLLFWIWYSFSLIANQEKFGTLSAVLGLFQLGCFAYFIYVAVMNIPPALEIASKPGLNEQQIEKETAPYRNELLQAAFIIELVPAVLTTLWFLSLRTRVNIMDDQSQDSEPTPQRGVF